MLVRCPDCGTPMSDKAKKCPKCGKVLTPEKTEVLEYDGIVSILNRLAEIRSKFPNFWAKLSVFPDNFSTDPLIEVITGCDEGFIYRPSSDSGLDSDEQRSINQPPVSNAPWTGELSVQINENDLKKMNLVANFQALGYHEEFSTKGKPYLWVSVNDTKMAAKIVYDLLTAVFKKKLEAARFVITGVEDDSDNAMYNSSGVFLEGKGYGQGEFAYYKEPTTVQETQETAGSNDQDGGGSVSAIVWGFIGIIAILSGIGMCS